MLPWTTLRHRVRILLITILLLLKLLTAASSLDDPEVLSPDEFLDVTIGDPFHLTYYADIVRYVEYLSEGSNRVESHIYGKSTLGKPLVSIFISSPDNIENLEHLIQLNRALADPRILERDIEKVLDEAKLFLWIECNIHSNEPAGAEIALEMAYELSTTSDVSVLSALNDVVIVIIPSTEPDGHDHFTDWFHTYKHTGLVRTDPPIYGAYVGHDNNRDRFNQSLNELRDWARFWLETKPAISVDVHQSRTPYVFFVTPGRDPTYPEISPLIEASWKMIGGHIMAKMYAKGLPGVTSNVVFDMWYPGYGDTWPSLHHSVGMLIEIWSGFISGPTDYEGWSTYAVPEDLRYSERDSNTPWPWPGGWWTLRDQIDYGKVALYALLEVAADQKDFFFRNRYSIVENQVARGLQEPPFAWIIPAQQNDPIAASILVDTLIKNGIEVHQSLEEFESDGMHFAAGSFIVFMSQPYGNFAKTLMEVQHYPEGVWAYDVTAWTLPLMIGAEAVRVDDPSVLRVESSLIDESPSPPGGGLHGFSEEARVFVLKRNSMYTARALNALMAAEEQVFVAMESAVLESLIIEKGDFLVSESSAALVEELGEDLGLRFDALSDEELGNISTRPLDKPRIALYHAWLDLREEGWTRLVLDEHWFDYDRLSNEALLEGSLAESYDVIVMPDVRRWAALSGYTPGTYPDPYAGGIGQEGLDLLKEFVNKGGRLITLGRINEIVFDDFEVGIGAVETTDSFHVPGSILKIEIHSEHFETAYYRERPWGAALFRPGYSAVEVLSEDVVVLARFAPNCLMSGWAQGTEEIEGKAAIVVLPQGKGEFVVFGFDPTYRNQVKNMLPLFFDSIFGSSLP